MPETVTLWLKDAEMTRSAGASLAHSLYALPSTLWLTGALGAGKTTFLQGLGRELGIQERLTSPTFALEQRYATHSFGVLLHIDLYRLNAQQAVTLVSGSDEHVGLRCIEWAERLPVSVRASGIEIALEEDERRGGRSLAVTFRDMPIPTEEQIRAWRQEIFLPHMIALHCDAVAQAAVRLGTALLERGQIVRMAALHAAGRLHDLLRFVDFHRGASHREHAINPEHAQVWQTVRERYPGMRHEDAAAEWLHEEGFPHVAQIIRVHGLIFSGLARATIEQKLLYYADKRVKLDEIVSLEERLRDFTERYSKAGTLTESDDWYEEARRTERELFPEGPPF